MSDLQIRWATPGDSRGVAVVHVDAWRAAYQDLIPGKVLDALNVDQSAERWARWIASSLAGHATDGGSGAPHRLLVAEAYGRVVGWAGFGAGRDEGMAHLGELAGLYVHPDYWSRQVGHALITRAEYELFTAGWGQAYLWVLDGNDRAMRFYEQHDWRADGREKFGDAGGAQRLHEVRHLRSLGRAR